MATTTPNFGWPVPTSTDLVKDGATAMEALGDAIDTSMVDLKGGTTGQVLAKASNTDMDFSWVAQDDSNAIQNTIVDAKGDLIAASAADTPARLAVGSNGETLVVDSSTSTGLRYQGSMTAGKNVIINGGFDVWQRGTSVAANAASAYTADRWLVGPAAAGLNTTTTRQATNDTTNLPFIQYCARIQRNSGVTANGYIQLFNSQETINSVPYAGKTVTVSFYARAGANYSSASNALGLQLRTGTGTDEPASSYTGQATPIDTTFTLTTTWQRFTATGTIATTAKEMGLNFYYLTTGTAGTNDYYEITGVQLELGSVASAFARNSGTIQGELAACQRYYSIGQSISIVQPSQDGGGNFRSFNQITMPVTMRTLPTVVVKALVSGTVNKVTSNYYAGLWGGSQADSTGVASAGDITNNNFMVSGINSTNKYYDGANWTATAEL